VGNLKTLFHRGSFQQVAEPVSLQFRGTRSWTDNQHQQGVLQLQATEICQVYQGIDAMHALPQMWIAEQSKA
jgi:hypothetical protein